MIERGSKRHTGEAERLENERSPNPSHRAGGVADRRLPGTRPFGIRPFGTLPTGERVDEYTLTNSHGLSVSIIPYGAIVTQLHVPDGQGKTADVVCGFNTLDDYLIGHPYFGCIAGRVAGRIADARFAIDGIDYSLAANDPPNHLHGGQVGFDKKLWTVDSADHAAIHLSLISPDGDEGYPGTVRVRAVFRLTEADEFRIDYDATTDVPTPLNLTHHGYFNLAGEGSVSVEDHWLQIHADTYAPADEAMGLRGRRERVTNANTFQKPRRLGDAVAGLWQRHGDIYFVDDGEERTGGALKQNAVLYDSVSGRVMTIATTEPCLQLYAGVGLDGTLIGKSGRPYQQFGAVCLEAERYPDGVNTPALGDIILRPGETYRQTTIHTFSNAR